MLAQVEDEVTGTGAIIHSIVLGLRLNGSEPELLRDWRLLLELNQLKPVSEEGIVTGLLEKGAVETAWPILVSRINDLQLDFKRPKATLKLLLLPAQTEQLADAQ